MRGLLDPKVDFVFKNIFGSPKHPRILISFLNATLKPVNKIIQVEIKGTDIAKQFIEDKYSRLDVKATTNNGEIINTYDCLQHYVKMRYSTYDADQIPNYMYNIANNFLVCCNPELAQTSKCPYELEYICINNLYKTNEYFDVVYSCFY